MSYRILSAVCGLVGFGLVVAGIALMHIPSALCFAGLCLLGYGWLLDKVAAVVKRREENATRRMQPPSSAP